MCFAALSYKCSKIPDKRKKVLSFSLSLARFGSFCRSSQARSWSPPFLGQSAGPGTRFQAECNNCDPALSDTGGHRDWLVAQACANTEPAQKGHLSGWLFLFRLFPHFFFPEHSSRLCCPSRPSIHQRSTPLSVLPGLGQANSRRTPPPQSAPLTRTHTHTPSYSLTHSRTGVSTSCSHSTHLITASHCATELTQVSTRASPNPQLSTAAHIGAALNPQPDLPRHTFS